VSILLVAYSARFLAESALSGGFSVRAADYFGDRDLRDRVESVSVLRDLKKSFSPAGLLTAAERLSGDALVYAGGVENHPALVARLGRRRELLGNPPEVLVAVRDWKRLGEVLRKADLPAPEMRFPGEEGRAGSGGRWLVKPRRSAAGAGIHFWRGEVLPRGNVLQEFLPGMSGSFTFLADGRRAVPVGCTEQLIGRKEFGGKPFAWCGNVAPLAFAPDTEEEKRAEVLLRRMAEALTEAFSLRGLNTVDFVLVGRKGERLPVPVEINPRPSASLEVLEALLGRSLFGEHVRACRGVLFEESFRPESGFFGKGIVFARRKVTVSATGEWRASWRADIPHDGEEIARGNPVCTVFGQGKTREECLEALRAAALRVRREIGDRVFHWERGEAERWDCGSSS
jgi:predicted ATP-grasp superfamily ATP-dependent carboligase